MNEPGARSLRNVAVIANRGAGKTSLAEAILFTTGAISTLGSVTQGTTVSDFEPEEIHHRSSVSTSLLRCSWNSTTMNLLDTPGALYDRPDDPERRAGLVIGYAALDEAQIAAGIARLDALLRELGV